MAFPAVTLAILLFSRLCLGDFGYDGSHGPSHWGDDYHTCVGKHQSPINIEEHNVRNVTLSPLKFIGLNVRRSSFLTNNGHTVMLRVNDSETAKVTGGPLGENIYVFEQLHFHWGENDREGSEDLINNHSFAMELHAVFYKQDYRSMNEAVNHPDGLTVLAYFYEADDIPNPTYESIVEVLPSVEVVGAQNSLPEPLLLVKLLSPDLTTLQNYFTYNGSLTTPPCSEVVTWIDFKEPQLLSHNQLSSFRNVQTTDGHKLTHNFRPVQPLEDRLVYHNIPNVENTQHNHRHNAHGHSGQHGSKLPFSLAAFSAVIAVLLLAI